MAPLHNPGGLWRVTPDLSVADLTGTGTGVVVSTSMPTFIHELTFAQWMIEVEFDLRVLSGEGLAYAWARYSSAGSGLAQSNPNIEPLNFYSHKVAAGGTQRRRVIRYAPPLLMTGFATNNDVVRVYLEAAGQNGDTEWEASNIKARLRYLPVG